MRKVVVLIINVFICVLGVWAQSEQDIKFLEKFTPETELIEGRSYLFETTRRHTSPQYGKSRLIKADDKPEFNRRGELTNGEPFASFGEKPLVYKGVKHGKVMKGDNEVLCLILQFTWDKQQYYAYETENANPRNCAYYDFLDIEFMKNIEKQLVGKTLYTRRAFWWKYNEDKMNSNLKLTKVPEGTCKFCPVTITRIDNDYDNKFIVLFRKEGDSGEYCFSSVIFDSKEIGKSLSFDRYFTFDNPKNNYPDISEERWEQIMNMNVRKGFTPEEVKIAYGEPDEKYTENDDEIWLYENVNERAYAISFKENIVDNVKSISTFR